MAVLEDCKLGQIGENHNFGKAVTRISREEIYKPRSIFWEWLFLGPSPLRKLLDQIKVDGLCITAGWPTTQFITSDQFQTGSVKFIHADPSTSLKPQDTKIVGFTFAIALWFGIGDLHFENIIFGDQEINKFAFAPLDIENIFEEAYLPSQLLLLPNDELTIDHSGIGRLSNMLNEPNLLLALCQGMYYCFQALNQHRLQLEQIVTELISTYQPTIRKILRSTYLYVHLLENKIYEKDLQVPLHPSEIEQLSRGDVPYFFRYAHSEKLFYYSKPEISCEALNLGYGPNYNGLPSLIIATGSNKWERDLASILKLSLLQLASKLSKRFRALDCSKDEDRIFILDTKLYVRIGNLSVSTNA